MVDLFRYVNLTLGVGILLGLVFRRLRHPEWYFKESLRADIFTIALFWDLALIVDTIEQLYGTGTSLRVGFAMAALLTTLALLLRPAKDWTGNTKP